MENLIDIGLNLMHPSFRKNRESIIEDAIDEGVSKFIITGTNVKASQIACEYASNYPGTLYSTSGVHPHDAKTCDDHTLLELEKIAKNGVPVARANNATAHLYIANPFGGKTNALHKLFLTHPPVEERLAALRGMSVE